MAKDGSNWLGKQLAGRYTVQKQLGAGGMGMVLLAHDQNLNTEVVVKVPHRSMLADEEFVKRFAQEVRSLVTLSHPHVVKVMDVGLDDGVPFAVMQYLPGGDLKDRQPVGADGRPAPQDPATLASWLPEVAKALDFIHSQGYVHRDIKPDNIIFDGSGNAYVGDFGIAKALGKNLQRAATGRLTQEGVALGTPEYMAPEVVLGENYDGRADQYALAATVFEVLCGRPPFQGNTPAAIIVQATTKSPPRPGTFAPAILGPAEQCILKGLSRKPAGRHANCTAFAVELIRLLGGPAPAPRAGAAAPDGRAAAHASSAAAAHGGLQARGAESSDTMLPTSRYEAELSDTAVRTPPPPAGAARSTECPTCRHRFPILDPAADPLTCPQCGRRFPNPTLAAPKAAQRDTPRHPTETVRQEPPPIPPRHKTQKSHRDQTSQVQQPPRAAEGPFGPAREAPDEAPTSLAGEPDVKPGATRGAYPKPADDIEPPTVFPGFPGSMELQRPYTAAPPTPVSKPAPARPEPPKPEARPAPPQRRPEPRPPVNAAPPAPPRPAAPRTPQQTASRSGQSQVKEREDADRCRYCGRPTWSTSRSCVACKQAGCTGPGTFSSLHNRWSRRRVVGLVLKIFAALSIVGGMSFLLFWLLSNRPIIVARDGSGHYESVAEALERVKPGGRIEIRKGHYSEDRLVIDKPVTIVGADQNDVTINVKSAIILKHSDASLQDVTVHGLRSASTPPAPAAKKATTAAPRRRSFPVLPAAMLFQLPAKTAAKSDAQPGSSSEGGSSIFSTVDAKQQASRSAIRVTDGKPSIRNCVVTSDDGVGIIVEGKSARPTIRDCRIHGCRGAGLYCMNGASAVVEECRFESNGGSGVVFDGGNSEIRKCRIQDTKPVGKNLAYGVEVLKGAPMIEECEISGTRSGIYVDAKADASIRRCKVTKSSLVGLQILGKAGVTDKCEVSDSLIGIYVGSKGNARFDGCKVHKNKERGFLIAGSANIENCSVTNQKERGIQVSSKTGDATISNTTVSENGQHGIAVWGKARIENNCDVSKNGDDGLYVHDGASASVANCKFRDGLDLGVVCFGTIDVTKCEVSRHKKGGVSIQDQGRGTLRDLTVESNKGTGVVVNGTAKLENCRITGNDFSGVYVGSGNAEVISCRINANKLYGVFVGSHSVKNLTKYGAATVTGGDLTKNAKESTKAVDTRAVLTVTGTKTDQGTGKP